MKTTEPEVIKRGLRQCCPLLPLLFMIYLVSGMEKRLEQCELGFDASYMERGNKVNQVIYRLLYADDIVLLADSRDKLQELITICAMKGHTLGLSFSGDKSGVIVFNNEKKGSLKIQDTVIDHVETYKYLGVWLSKCEKTSVLVN